MDSRSFAGFQLVNEMSFNQRHWQDVHSQSSLITKLTYKNNTVRDDIIELHYRGVVLKNDKLKSLLAELNDHPITTLSFNDCNLEDNDAVALAKFITEHRSLVDVKLSLDHMTSIGKMILQTAINESSATKQIDLYEIPESLEKKCMSDSVQGSRYGLFKRVSLSSAELNIVTHAQPKRAIPSLPLTMEENLNVVEEIPRIPDTPKSGIYTATEIPSPKDLPPLELANPENDQLVVTTEADDDELEGFVCIEGVNDTLSPENSNFVDGHWVALCRMR